METREVETHSDFLNRELRVSPSKALCEAIWNSCDADSTDIYVEFKKNDMDSIVECVIKDNGIGICYDNLNENFKYLGFSEKRRKFKSDLGRLYHGKLGKGRYNMLSIANSIEWNTTYKEEDNFINYTLRINANDNKKILISDLSKNSQKHTGTITCIAFKEKEGEYFNNTNNVIEDIVKNFAPYLKSYSDISLYINADSVNINEYIENTEEKKICIVDEHGNDIHAKLIIIKWKTIRSKGNLYFCDEKGAIIKIADKLKANGIDAYLCGEEFSKDSNIAMLDTPNMLEWIKEFVSQSLRIINNYAVLLENEDIYNEIKLLKKKEIYPYIKQPKSDVEKAEQIQFDALAIEVNKILPQLRKSTQKVKKMTYSLLKETIKTEPSSFAKIIDSVIELTDEQKDALANILKRTSLPAIIKTSQLLVNRMQFLDALYLMVYDENVEKGIKERTQFQKILLDNLWIFGEDYAYGADDISIRNLLKKFIKKLGRDELSPDVPYDGVYNLDRIPDICLFNKYKMDGNRYKNLVIEIKKPKKVLGKEEYDQIMDYYHTITDSSNFPDANTTWHFILVGRSLDKRLKDTIADHENLGYGNVVKKDKATVTIVTWAEIIQTNKAKIEYLQNAMEYNAKEESEVLEYLHDNYSKYLSDKFDKEGND